MAPNAPTRRSTFLSNTNSTPSTSTLLEPAPPISLTPRRPHVSTTTTATTVSTPPPSATPIPPTAATATAPTPPTLSTPASSSPLLPAGAAAAATATPSTSTPRPSTATAPTFLQPFPSAPPHAKMSPSQSAPARRLLKSVLKPLCRTNQENHPQHFQRTRPTVPPLPIRASLHLTHHCHPHSRPNNPALR